MVQLMPDCLSEESEMTKVLHNGRMIKTSYLIDIVHTIILKYYFKKLNSYALSSTILRKRYGHLYNYYIDYLIKKDIISLENRHIGGKSCRIYSLNPDIFRNKIGKYENLDKILIKKNIFRIESNNLENKLGKNYPIMDKVREKLVRDIWEYKIDRVSSIDFLSSIENDLEKNIYVVESIHSSNLFYQFDNYGRFHSNFTILKSEIRKKFLSVDNEKTFEFDIKNSQPLMLCKLIDRHGKEIVDKDEYDLYRKLVKSGEFYDFLISKSNIKNKKIIKTWVYRVFFGKNYGSDWDKLFDMNFPSILKFIKKYKNENGGYKSLSHNLQLIESDLVFNKIVNDIIVNYPHIKILTIHDSIICPHKFKNEIGKIFRERIENFTDG